MPTELDAAATVTRRFVEQEHRELAAGIERIEEVARGIESETAHQLPHRIRGILDWFTLRFEQHLAWEDAWLYPQLDRRAGTVWVTRLMRFEHDQIRAAFRKLEADWEAMGPLAVPDRQVLASVRGRLHGLACVLHAHIEREEWLLVPILEEV